MSLLRHALVPGGMALAIAACAAFSAQVPAPKGGQTMPLMPEDRNRLVSYADNPDAPPAPTLGVAVRLAVEGEPRFKVGEQVTLHGVFRADRTLIKGSGGEPKSFVFLTLVRGDKPFGQTLQLYTPKVRVSPPAGEEPAVGPGYREGASFKVDIARFFELPAEPGGYTVQASIGTRFSDRLEFEIVPR